MILDLFSGARGWSEGLRMLGLEDIGIEWAAAACATAAAAGHATIRADVSRYPTAPFVGKVEGLIASPPCPDWSMAGHRAGFGGTSGHLVREVPWWVGDLRPRWVACEQVPPALPAWEQYAHLFRSWGYRAWTGILNAADYGVPQTRQRALLLALLDGPALPPGPTHAKRPQPGLFGDLLPWVTMAEALGWQGDGVGRLVPGSWADGRGGNRRIYAGDEPAPTLAFGHDASGWEWTLHTNRGQEPDGSRQTVGPGRPAPALTAKAGGLASTR